MDQTKTQDSVPKKMWEGKVSATLDKASPDQVWILFKDFFNIDKLFPALDSCSAVSGVNGQPGCVRYCRTTTLGIDGSNGATAWAKERLLTIDDNQCLLSYDILESNIGLESYVATVRIVPMGDGCVIEWGFRVNPVEGWALDDLVSKVYEPGMQGMAEKIKAAVSVTS